MEEAHSVHSPRRVLSFSKRKKQKPGFQDTDNIRSSPFKASEVHGPKPSEVYGFVGSISTVVATVIFLIWAYVPDKVLESIGIHYYPSRYWVLAIPTYLMVTLVLALVFYIGLNFIATPPPTSLNTLFDEYSREPEDFDSQMEEGDERPIDPISDIDCNAREPEIGLGVDRHHEGVSIDTIGFSNWAFGLLIARIVGFNCKFLEQIVNCGKTRVLVAILKEYFETLESPYIRSRNSKLGLWLATFRSVREKKRKKEKEQIR